MHEYNNDLLNIFSSGYSNFVGLWEIGLWETGLWELAIGITWFSRSQPILYVLLIDLNKPILVDIKDSGIKELSFSWEREMCT